MGRARRLSAALAAGACALGASAVLLGASAVLLGASAVLLGTPAVSLGAPTAAARSRPAPVLGGAGATPGSVGFGRVRPREIYRANTKYRFACHIRWAAWGGPMAVGVGSAWYVAPRAATADGHWALAVVVLYRLGTWHQHPAYTRYRWYFPEGGSLSGGGVEDCLI